MINIFTTPELKTFVFNIPENITTNSDGFYNLDHDFKGINTHINFDYLSHDLEYRGLDSKNTYSDRYDYLKGKVSYEDYCTQFTCTKKIEEALTKWFTIKKLMASNCEHFNDIKIKKWDDFPSLDYIDRKIYKAVNNVTYGIEIQRTQPLIWSPSTNVCIAKVAARLLVRRLKAQNLEIHTLNTFKII